MKKNVRKIRTICFLCVFLNLFIGMTYVLRNDSDMKQRFANFYYEPADTIDMIYIGSSPVHPYWAAPLAWEQHGFTSASLSTNVQQPKAAIFLLKEALKRQSPSVVVFELRMFSREQKEFDEGKDYEAFTRNVTDNLKLSINRSDAINQLVPNVSERVTYYFDIAKYHTGWKNIRKSDMEYYKFKKEDLKKGHLIRSDVIDLSNNWHDYKQIKEQAPMPLEQEEHLRELLDYCKEKGITALFTINPYTDITEQAQRQFNYMKNIVVNEYGYDFLNMNLLYNEMGIDFSKDFYNGGHMNTEGAEKFTTFLSNYLVTHYDLPDKRIDENYDSWNKAYTYWRAEADNSTNIIDSKVKEGKYDE